MRLKIVVRSAHLVWHRPAMVLGIVVLLALPLQAGAQTQQKYTVMMQSEVAGAMHADLDGVGRVTVDFSYRDNGRGPDLKEGGMAYAPAQVYEALGIRPFSNAAAIVRVEPDRACRRQPPGAGRTVHVRPGCVESHACGWLSMLQSGCSYCCAGRGRRSMPGA